MNVSPRPLSILALALALSLVPRPAPADGAGHDPDPASERVRTWTATLEGLRVEARMEQVGRNPLGWVEGQPVRVELAVTDSTGQPVSRLYPAAWLDRLPASRTDEAADACKQKVQTFLGGGLMAEPEGNLNVYHLLALNEDKSVTVVDPLFGYGGTKLLAFIELEANGEDWVVGPNAERVFVSVPAADHVAVIDTVQWKLERTVDVGARPVQVALQGDGRYLWVAAEGTREGFAGSGVTVIDTTSLEVVAHLATGSGPHQIAFSTDDRFALVTNGRDQSLTVIDVRTLEAKRTLALGVTPIWIDWSSSAEAAYVSSREGGVLVISPERAEPIAKIPTEPGLGRIKVSPDGRWAVVVSPAKNVVHFIDTALNRTLKTADVEEAPDQITFNGDLTYVHHAASEDILMISLRTVAAPGEKVSAVDFTGGQKIPAEGTLPSPGELMMKAPGGDAMLIANPADGAVYYYKEGMAAPMGNFRNYSRSPRAILVVDRSLRERRPGVYDTVVRLGRPGEYDLALFTSSPATRHCFPLEVGENPVLRRERLAKRLDFEVLTPETREIVVGKPVTMRFRARDSATEESRVGLKDLEALVFLAPGIWQQRMTARPLDDGSYELTFTPAEEGLYMISFSVPSLGIGANRMRPVGFLASAPAP
jgi:DNA-binding beta-propeller fold protein YncE